MQGNWETEQIDRTRPHLSIACVVFTPANAAWGWGSVEGRVQRLCSSVAEVPLLVTGQWLSYLTSGKRWESSVDVLVRAVCLLASAQVCAVLSSAVNASC